MPASTTHAGWTYREVFARDSYETFTGLLADGDRASARDMVLFMFDKTQQPDGSFPRDSELDGAVAPDTFGLSEIDEVAYPLLMAWEAGLSGNAAFYRDHIRPAADYIVDHGPSTGAERWEEHPGYSPATIASEIAGLVAAGQLAEAAGDTARAHLYLATADDYQRNVKAWTVTTSGPDGPRYFIRESVSGNPNTDQTYNLGNGSLNNIDQRSIIDAGFLELTRMGELSATDPDVRASLKVVGLGAREPDELGPRVAPLRDQGQRQHRRLRRLLRARSDQLLADRRGLVHARRRAPATCGRCWTASAPSRTSSRARRRPHRGLAATFQRMTWGLGYVPEQVWEDPDTPASPFGADPTSASIGFTNGKAAGSAAPLIWGQAQYLRLVLDLHDGKVSDQPSITRARYVSPGPPSDVPVTITVAVCRIDDERRHDDGDGNHDPGRHRRGVGRAAGLDGEPDHGRGHRRRRHGRVQRDGADPVGHDGHHRGDDDRLARHRLGSGVGDGGA